MPLGHRDQPVQALPSDRTDHALTDRIRLRASYRGAQYPPQELAVIPKSESRHRLAAGALVLAKSILGGLHHEYSLAPAVA